MDLVFRINQTVCDRLQTEPWTRLLFG